MDELLTSKKRQFAFLTVAFFMLMSATVIVHSRHQTSVYLVYVRESSSPASYTETLPNLTKTGGSNHHVQNITLEAQERIFSPEQELENNNTNSIFSPSQTSSLEKAMEEVIRLLIRDPQKAEEYLRQYPLDNFRFYVYDMPKHLRWDTLVQCVEEKYEIFHEDHTHLDICPWMSRRCAQTNTLGAYNTRRYNRNADAIIAQAFAEYQGPLRTTDPEKADLFIVPFPASAYCLCNHMRGNPKLCSRYVGPNWIQNKLLPKLPPIYNKTTNAHKHVFLNSLIRGVHQIRFDTLKPTPFLWTLDQKGNNGAYINQTLVIPYANLHPSYGPNHVPAGGYSESSPKNYSLVSDISRIQVASGSRERQLFVEHAHPYLEEHGYMLGGLPVKVVLPESKNTSNATKEMRHLSSSNTTTSNTTSSLPKPASAGFDENAGLQRFRESILCPTLRGDTPSQKRFFDALLSGCIPVVFKYPAKGGKGLTYAGEGEIGNWGLYPFAQGSFPGMPEMGLNYSELVVELELGNMSSEFSHLDDVIQNHMDNVVRPKQREIARSANLWTYGLGSEGLLSPNSIVGLLVQTRHFLLFQENLDLAMF